MGTFHVKSKKSSPAACHVKIELRKLCCDKVDRRDGPCRYGALLRPQGDFPATAARGSRDDRDGRDGKGGRDDRGRYIAKGQFWHELFLCTTLYGRL